VVFGRRRDRAGGDVLRKKRGREEDNRAQI
jgi:hypothetical protein